LSLNGYVVQRVVKFFLYPFGPAQPNNAPLFSANDHSSVVFPQRPYFLIFLPSPPLIPSAFTQCPPPLPQIFPPPYMVKDYVHGVPSKIAFSIFILCVSPIVFFPWGFECETIDHCLFDVCFSTFLCPTILCSEPGLPPLQVTFPFSLFGRVVLPPPLKPAFRSPYSPFPHTFIYPLGP